MRTARVYCILLSAACVLAGCTEPKHQVAGSMRFVLGGTGGSGVGAGSLGLRANRSASAALVAGDEYIVSPKQAKVTFTSVVFVDATGLELGNSDFTNCTVTYDRSLASGSSLLDCPFTAPVGDITQMRLYFDKTVQLLVSDATVGIYSDPASATKYSTTAPAGGAAFVPLTITIGDGTSRATPVIFASPITIADGTTPTLYVTVDMIHTVQMSVNTGGATLTANVGNDPVALFGGLEPGTSSYYSGANTVGAYKVQGVPSLRVFSDQAGHPLYTIIGPNFCGVDGPKAAWASPPIGATIGGWLGKDGSNIISFALPTTSAYTSYAAYYTMPEVTVIGQTTSLKCKITTAPPAPADGKTYASGAPALVAPDKTVTLTLLAK